MKQIYKDSYIKLITKYATLLIVMQVIHQAWFYFHFNIGGYSVLEKNFLGQYNWITIKSASYHIMNFIFAIILYYDLKRFHIKSYILPIITLVFGYFGIYFSLLIILYKIHKDKKTKAIT